ncbi:hypothetical protein F5148DRAFT_1368186 [Russula earlei]|uniref:Uncharacterized protein n=1 Tax=Russula earlei TaxID=71964 RepID=A0ACC0U9F2_9AGAM|nr:hypothetical protein F5148DRAFT_1368186 [Russula earlei]
MCDTSLQYIHDDILVRHQRNQEQEGPRTIFRPELANKRQASFAFDLLLSGNDVADPSPSDDSRNFTGADVVLDLPGNVWQCPKAMPIIHCQISPYERGRIPAAPEAAHAGMATRTNPHGWKGAIAWGAGEAPLLGRGTAVTGGGWSQLHSGRFSDEPVQKGQMMPQLAEQRELRARVAAGEQGRKRLMGRSLISGRLDDTKRQCHGEDMRGMMLWWSDWEKSLGWPIWSWRDTLDGELGIWDTHPAVVSHLQNVWSNRVSQHDRD